VSVAHSKYSSRVLGALIGFVIVHHYLNLKVTAERLGSPARQGKRTAAFADPVQLLVGPN
jgi:hypothetical protein